MKKLLLLIFCSLTSFTILGQNTRLIKGVVFDENDVPLKGATVSCVGTSDNTITNENGVFNLLVSPYAKKINISLEGYLPLSAEIDGSYLILKLSIDKNYAYKKLVETEAKIKAEEQARIAQQKEAEEKAKTEEQARIAQQKEAEEKAKAEEKARIAQQKEAEEKAKAEEKARIAQQKETEKKAKAEERRAQYAKQQSGFASLLDLNYRFPLNSLSGNLGVSYIAGYRFNNMSYLGLGAGLNYFFNSPITQIKINSSFGIPLTNSQISIPIYAYFRINFINKQITPFFAISAGYEFSEKKTTNLDLCNIEYNTSNIFVNPQIGVNYRISIKTSLYLALGFQAFSMPYCAEHTGYNAKITQKVGYGVDFHLGFSF